MSPDSVSDFDLKPCPFCGGVPDMWFRLDGMANRRSHYTATVCCYKCDIMLYSIRPTKSAALSAVTQKWNTRAPL